MYNAQPFTELETKAIRRFAKVSIVSYSRPFLMKTGCGTDGSFYSTTKLSHVYTKSLCIVYYKGKPSKTYFPSTMRSSVIHNKLIKSIEHEA